ncbi:hypothetical protein [Amycolatopsis solani]|uniref:hypothetical protein n=1 Tax=Amycolatopsis solani TaxID=3028615 RepID=UPI0025B2249D|nr:hypothetical protein [Amycolatopsis sp. MEP2-6]
MNVTMRVKHALPQVLVPQDVAEKFDAEIVAHPKIEVGGKWVGFIVGLSKYDRLEERLAGLADLKFVVFDFIEDGPEAKRTATYHIGDRRWQESCFRRLEERYPEIENLGSWHSHHPNRSVDLSDGDIRGYQQTVDSPGHNHDYFFASLAVNISGFSTARHYLFVRGGDRYFELPRDHVHVVARAEPEIMIARLRNDAKEKKPEAVTGGSDGSMPAEEAPGVTSERTPAHDVENRRAEAGKDGGSEQRASLGIAGWTESPKGREALIREQDRIRRPEFASIRLVVVRNRLVARGLVETTTGPVTVSFLYPTGAGLADGLLKLGTTVSPVVEVTLPGDLVRDFADVKTELGKFIEYVTRGTGRSKLLRGFALRSWVTR